MSNKRYTIYEACQHPESIAKGLRPSALTMAVTRGDVPATLTTCKAKVHRTVYVVTEEDLLDFLEVCQERTAQNIAAKLEDAAKTPKRKAEGSPEYRKKLHKLRLMEEAREYGVSLIEYLSMIGQQHLEKYFNDPTAT